MDTNATRAWCVACALTALVGCSSAETLGPGAESDASVSGLDVQPDVTVALDGQGGADTTMNPGDIATSDGTVTLVDTASDVDGPEPLDTSVEAEVQTSDGVDEPETTSTPDAVSVVDVQVPVDDADEQLDVAQADSVDEVGDTDSDVEGPGADAVEDTQAPDCVDGDDDGVCVPDDCNDSNPNANPDLDEVCGDGVDNNCNGEVDEDCEDEPLVIDETSCEAAAAAFTSAGCLFAPIVGNDSSNTAGGPLPWAVIAANANDEATDVSLYDPAGTLIETVVIEGGELHIFELDGPTNMLWEHGKETGIFQKVFRLEATRPIVAYQFQPYSSSHSATADAALLLPRHAWGNNYLVLNQKGSGSTWVTIVALEEVTVRVLMPPVMNGATMAGGDIPALGPGEVHLLPLHAGESARIYASSSVDMSGMAVFSGDQDVAVFVGSPGTSLPGPNWVGYNDYLEEQVPPRTAWGQDVAVVKFKPITDEEDVYRVMADKNGTTVTITGDVEAQYALDEGEFVQFQSAGTFHVSGTDAILVAHGMVSAKVSNGTPNSSDWPGWFEGTNNCGSSGTLAAEDMGDPAVSFITPYAQYRNEYVFLTPYTYAWDVLTITAPDWAWDTVLVDGLPLPAPTPVAGTEDLAYARFLVADGPHHVESSMVGVGIEVHGYDCRLSYAYAGGLSLGAINEPPPPPDEVIDP